MKLSVIQLNQIKNNDFVVLENRVFKVYTVLPWEQDATTLLTLKREDTLNQIVLDNNMTLNIINHEKNFNL